MDKNQIKLANLCIRAIEQNDLITIQNLIEEGMLPFGIYYENNQKIISLNPQRTKGIIRMSKYSAQKQFWAASKLFLECGGYKRQQDATDVLFYAITYKQDELVEYILSNHKIKLSKTLGTQNNIVNHMIVNGSHYISQFEKYNIPLYQSNFANLIVSLSIEDTSVFGYLITNIYDKIKLSEEIIFKILQFLIQEEKNNIFYNYAQTFCYSIYQRGELNKLEQYLYEIKNNINPLQISRKEKTESFLNLLQKFKLHQNLQHNLNNFTIQNNIQKI